MHYFLCLPGRVSDEYFTITRQQKTIIHLSYTVRPSVLSLTTLFHLLRDLQVSSQISFLPVGRIPLRRSLDIATYELFPAPKVSSINFPSVRSQSTRGGEWVDRLRGTWGYCARTFLWQTFPQDTCQRVCGSFVCVHQAVNKTRLLSRGYPQAQDAFAPS